MTRSRPHEAVATGWLHGGREWNRAVKQPQQHRLDGIVINGHDKLHWGDKGWPPAKSSVGSWVAAAEHWSRLRALMKENVATDDAPLPLSATVGARTCEATPQAPYLLMSVGLQKKTTAACVASNSKVNSTAPAEELRRKPIATQSTRQLRRKPIATHYSRDDDSVWSSTRVVALRVRHQLNITRANAAYTSSPPALFSWDPQLLYASPPPY